MKLMPHEPTSDPDRPSREGGPSKDAPASSGGDRLKVLLVANVLTHYRLPLYEELQRHVDLELVFFSNGREWYWQRTEEPATDTLANARWLRGWWVGGTRITPGLLPVVWRSPADVIVKDLTGKFALPVTYLLARARRKPFILWASLWEHPAHGIHRFTRPLMRHIYRRSNAVVTYGRHVSRHVIGEGARPERVLVAPQAARSLADSRPGADRWQRPLRLLYVGRLETWKGPHVLLQALARLGADVDWRLQVAGSGSQEQHLAAEARRLGIGRRVDFLGHVPNDSLGGLYASSAAVVVPSIRTASFSEPWALVVNEAMQAGTLVIASDCVGAVQDGLVRNGETGLVFRAGDVNSLAHRLAVVADAANTPSVRGIAEAGHDAISGYSFSTAARAFVAAANMARDPACRRSP